VFSVGGMGLAVAVLLWSVQRSTVGIVAGFVLMSAFMMLAMVSSDTFRVSVIEESVRGSALGAIGMLTGFATALAMPVAGYLKQISPMAPFWISLAAAAGLVVSVVALTRHDTRTGFQSEAASG
jgi:MFS family permease